MSSYTLGTDEKATQVMIGTSDLLLWGDLVTKKHLNVNAFLTTIAEDFVPLHDAKILHLTPAKQSAPLDRSLVFIKLEEILVYYPMADLEALPEETEVRRYEPFGAIIGSFQIEGEILKSPIARLKNMLLVAKDNYLPVYRATIRHVNNPWLGTFSSNLVQVRRQRLIVTIE